MVRRSKVVGPRCVTSYTSCDSLQNWFVPFQFTRTSSKIFGFPVKATLSTFLIIHIQFKDVSNQRKSEAQSHFLYNKAEPTPKCNCTPMYKRRWFKHWKLDQPFEIKAQNPCDQWEWRPQNYSGTGRDPITNCEKGNEYFWGYEEEVKNNLEKLLHALIQSSPHQLNQRGIFQPRDYLSQNSETDWMMKMCLDCHASIINIIEKPCLTQLIIR